MQNAKFLADKNQKGLVFSRQISNFADNMTINEYFDDAIVLLQNLIATPSVSRDEAAAATLLTGKMEQWGLSPQREGNNVWSICPDYDEKRETILLNAHIDTVKPVSSWTRNPYEPIIEGDRLYGLGANDCGGGLVSLLQVYRYLITVTERPFNVVFLASCEEEVSGKDGISRVLPLLPHIDVAIVGEPTDMQPATAEKGLMVIDGYARGKSGHAARNEGVNAIYEALDDLLWLREHQYSNPSPLLGATKATVTVVEAGTQHNVIPDTLHFIVDVRTNENDVNEAFYKYLCVHMKHCELKPRSFRLHSSSISHEHPLIRRCIAMGMKPFGSPTLSDQALMDFPSFKLGPGESSRSHSADEYICLSEIRHALDIYWHLLTP